MSCLVCMVLRIVNSNCSALSVESRKHRFLFTKPCEVGNTILPMLPVEETGLRTPRVTQLGGDRARMDLFDLRAQSLGC